MKRRLLPGFMANPVNAVLRFSIALLMPVLLFFGAKNLSIGGQAVIEGVMMKSPRYVSVAVRKNSGKIKTSVKRSIAWTKKHKILGWPFIRGIVTLLETLILGYKTLMISANEAVGEEDEKISAFELVLTIAIATIMFIVVFKLIPLWAANLTKVKSTYLFNLIEGIVKVGVLILYLWAISLMKDVKRIFQYHGAEHKTIDCYEKKMKLTVANVKKCSKEHARCGTTFIIFVLLISIIVYLAVPFSYSFWVKFALRLLLLPVIAGISYEVLRLGGRKKNWLTMMLSKPGLWLQSMTTREPEAKQIEVAIASAKAVLSKERPKADI